MFAGERIDDATIEAVERIVESFAHVRVLVVQAGAPRPRGLARVRAVFDRLRREPLSWPLELAHRFFTMLFVPSRTRASSDRVGLPAIESLEHVWLVRFEDVASDACLDAVRKFAPWLGISLDAPPLKRELFSVPELGTIRVHKSFLPEYRGGPPGFWELHDGAHETGVSIHWLDERRDAGDIVLQRRIDVPPFATPRGLEILLDDLGCKLLSDAVGLLDKGSATRTPQLVPSTPTRDRPAFLLRRRVEARCRKRRKQVHGAMPSLRDTFKNSALAFWVNTWCTVRNFFRGARGDQRTAILVYHRVSDTYTDTITTGIEQFVRQLELAKANYDVLDMHEWLQSRGKPRRRPAVVFAFDDGYSDNYVAAKLMRRAGVPCTFFVCTGIVGTEDPFLHDLERIGVRVPALTWDQCREMARRGFHFASHSVYHTDFATSELDAALEEIATASRHLRNQLGLDARDHWLAYPFGLPTEMSDDLRSRIERAGVEVLFASDGGTNTQNFDLHAVHRIPVSSAISDNAFFALIEGWHMDLGARR
ncbi:MAG: polysaccharide deacetylase family protein [Planctomycetes bacterium]|nr:polysaccharide deacetylase family protein [Planctomycetota bacterium]